MSPLGREKKNAEHFTQYVQVIKHTISCTFQIIINLLNAFHSLSPHLCQNSCSLSNKLEVEKNFKSYPNKNVPSTVF